MTIFRGGWYDNGRLLGLAKSVIVPVYTGASATGAGAVVLDDATGTGTGTIINPAATGTGGVVLADAVGSGAGSVSSNPVITGGGAATLDDATGSGAGNVTGAGIVSGTGAATLDDATGSGAGTVANPLPVTGTGAATLDDATGSGAGTVATPLTAPDAAFNFSPLTFSRIGTGTSSTFATNYSHPAARAALSPANTFYVDQATGNNNNDGLTTSTPFRSIDLAVKMVQDTGVLGCVKVKGSAPGTPRVKYLYTATQARAGQATNNATWRDALNSQFNDTNVIIEPWTDGDIFDSVTNIAAVTWTATSDPNIWKNSSAGNSQFDYANLNAAGSPRRLMVVPTSPADEAAAIAAINAAWALNSAVSDDGGATTYGLGAAVRIAGTMTYIRLFDNRNPNGDPNLFAISNTLNNARFYSSTTATTLFFTGMGIVGGSSNGAMYVQATGTFRVAVNFGLCRFVGGGTGALALIGMSLLSGGSISNSVGCDAVVWRCDASGGLQDGFNYHGNTKFVEIDCTGQWNGHDGGITNNGTTCHENCVGIRVNGKYLYSADRTLHDVNSSRSWNLGLLCSTRRGADGTATSTPYAAGIDGASGGQIWLDACKIANGPAGPPQYVSESNHSAAAIRYANLTFTPIVGPAASPGTVAPYTP